jgi:uncharacterized protein (TIGR03435 family)
VKVRILFILAIAATCWAQAEFEVASVKPNTTMDGGMSINRSLGGGFSAKNVTLQMLVTFAYDIRPHQLSGGPGWMESDRFDIVARPSAEDAAAEPKTYNSNDGSTERLQQRVQKLLADRFKLAIHTETKEMPILALVVAKGGPHLKDSDPASVGPQIHGQQGQLTGKKVPMKMFAEKILAQRMGRNVVDKTGLTGEYDFEIKYVEDRGAAAAATDVSGPDFLSAMQDQLGLKLESQKGPVQVIVVDHAEKATAN